MYAIVDRERGRGIILLIGMCATFTFSKAAIHRSPSGTEVECVTLVHCTRQCRFIDEQSHGDDDQSLQPKSNEPFTDEILSVRIPEHDRFDDMLSPSDQLVLMSELVGFLRRSIKHV